MLESGTFHLIMGAVWLVVGVAIVVIDPPGLRLSSFGLNRVSGGWVALLFAAYDGVRWWSLRSAYRRRAAQEVERRRPERRPAAAERERNPDFIFDEPPPPEKPV